MLLFSIFFSTFLNWLIANSIYFGIIGNSKMHQSVHRRHHRGLLPVTNPASQSSSVRFRMLWILGYYGGRMQQLIKNAIMQNIHWVERIEYFNNKGKALHVELRIDHHDDVRLMCFLDQTYPCDVQIRMRHEARVQTMTPMHTWPSQCLINSIWRQRVWHPESICMRNKIWSLNELLFDPHMTQDIINPLSICSLQPVTLHRIYNN